MICSCPTRRMPSGRWSGRFRGNSMNVRKVNIGLWTLTAGLAAGAVVCAALGLFTPVEVDSERDGVAQRAAATSQGSMGSQLSLADFESIWRLSFRKSLTDAPASAPVADAT